MLWSDQFNQWCPRTSNQFWSTDSFFWVQIIRIAHPFLLHKENCTFLLFPKLRTILILRRDLDSLEDNVQLLGRKVGAAQVEESSLLSNSEKTQEVSTLQNFLLRPDSAVSSVWHNCRSRESCHSFRPFPESLHVQFECKLWQPHMKKPCVNP